MTTRQAAQLLSKLIDRNVSVKTISTMCKNGRIKAEKKQLGGFYNWLVETAEVKRIAKNKTYLTCSENARKRWES